MKILFLFLFIFPTVEALSVGVSPESLDLDIRESGQLRFFNPNDHPILLKIQLPKMIDPEIADLTLPARGTATAVLTAKSAGNDYIKVIASDNNSADFSLTAGFLIPVRVREPPVLESSSRVYSVSKPYTGLAITGSIVAVGMAIFGISLLVRSLY